MSLRFALVLAALAAFAWPAASTAAVPPASLAMETLAAGSATTELSDVTGSANCPTFTFDVDGAATGPYTGTFTESGTVTLDGAGNVVSLQSSFTIAALDGTMISGTKSLGPTGGTGACTPNDFGWDTLVDASVAYTATINGAFQDSGTGTLHSEISFFTGFSPILGASDLGFSGSFLETFDVSNGVIPASTGGHVTGGGWILDPTTLHRVSFGFEVKGTATDLHGTCTVIDHTTRDHVRCLTVDSLVVAGTHATFGGTASVNGTTTRYQIDVDDLGEPGIADTFAITAGGFTAGGTLAGGNIQIHNG
jgi:hypothetical protein